MSLILIKEKKVLRDEFLREGEMKYSPRVID
jgi:hypothetical protein